MPVARFQMPDGRIARFQVPDGTTPEDAQSMMQDFVSKQSPAAPPEQGFMADIKKDYANRMQDAAGIEADYEAGKIGPIRKGIDLAGKVGAGMIGDVAMDVGKKAVEGLGMAYPGTAAMVKKAIPPVEEAAKAIAESAPVQAGTHVWQDFKAKNPEHARTVESMMNMAMFGAPIARPVEGAVLKTAENLAAVPGKVAKTADLVSTGLKADDLEALRGHLSELDKSAGENFRKVDSMDVNLGGDTAQSVVNDIAGIVKNPKEGMTQKLNPEFLSNVDTLQNDIKSGYTGLGTLHRARQLFGETAVRAKKAGYKNDARVATEAINKIDDAFEEIAKGQRGEGFVDTNAPEAINALNQGIDQWARMRSIEKIANIVDESGGEGKKVAAGFAKLVKDKKLSLGFTDEEKGYLKEAGKPGMLSKILPQIVSIGIGNKMGVAAHKVFKPGVFPMRAGNIQKAVEAIQARPEVEQYSPPQKLLAPPVKAAPQHEFVAYADGVIRDATQKELQDAVAARGRYSQMGMTPDVQKQVFINEMRGKFKDIWPKVDTETRGKIEDQIEQAWRENQSNIRQIIGYSEPDQSTAMSEAMMKARRR